MSLVTHLEKTYLEISLVNYCHINRPYILYIMFIYQVVAKLLVAVNLCLHFSIMEYHARVRFLSFKNPISPELCFAKKNQSYQACNKHEILIGCYCLPQFIQLKP